MIPLILYTMIFAVPVLIALFLVCLPPIQRELIYLHHVNWPFGSLAIPERFGLAPGKTRNFQLDTPDGEKLGVWHLLPSSVYRAAIEDFPPKEPFSKEVFERALAQRPTVIFFHGNAANRAVPYRIRIYTALTQQLDCNVIVADYRGFGDSTGTPSPAGLLSDARTVYDYVTHAIDRQGGSKGSGGDVVLMGHSLGTGVIARLAAQLSDQGLTDRLRAIVLVSPFTSITDVILDYTTLAFIPFMSRLGRIPGLTAVLNRVNKHKYESILTVPHIDPTIPILLMHAKNDWTIPITHSRRLYQVLRSRIGDEDEADVSEKEVSVANWGTVHSFTSDGKGEVVLWEGELGGHNDLGWTEGGLDLIARVARL